MGKKKLNHWRDWSIEEKRWSGVAVSYPMMTINGRQPAIRQKNIRPPTHRAQNLTI